MRGWLPAALLIGAAGALLVAERRRPLRRQVEPGLRRLARNVAIGAAATLVVQAVERPLAARVSEAVERSQLGLVPGLGLRPWAETAVTLALLDYTLYWWHVLLHRVPPLERCHAVHHGDRDLDVSTAARFHFGEFLASVPWRVTQVGVIGVKPKALRLWSALTLASVLFHHANLRLPAALERLLGLFVTTPRLHGIHHSVVRSQRESNYSSGLTLWDRLHGTLRDDVPQEAITIGLPGQPGSLPAGQALLQPFRGASPAPIRHRGLN